MDSDSRPVISHKANLAPGQWSTTCGPWPNGRPWRFFQGATELGINQDESIMRLV